MKERTEMIIFKSKCLFLKGNYNELQQLSTACVLTCGGVGRHSVCVKRRGSFAKRAHKSHYQNQSVNSWYLSHHCWNVVHEQEKKMYHIKNRNHQRSKVNIKKASGGE